MERMQAKISEALKEARMKQKSEVYDMYLENEREKEAIKLERE